MLKHINRKRMDPQDELEILFHHFETREFYGPNGTAVLNDCDVNDEWMLFPWETRGATSPLVWNDGLTEASRQHGEWMIH